MPDIKVLDQVGKIADSTTPIKEGRLYGLAERSMPVLPRLSMVVSAILLAVVYIRDGTLPWRLGLLAATAIAIGWYIWSITADRLPKAKHNP